MRNILRALFRSEARTRRVLRLVGGLIGALCACAALVLLPRIRDLWLEIVLCAEAVRAKGQAAFQIAYGVSLWLLGALRRQICGKRNE